MCIERDNSKIKKEQKEGVLRPEELNEFFIELGKEVERLFGNKNKK
jgi:hypothetical protein